MADHIDIISMILSAGTPLVFTVTPWEVYTLIIYVAMYLYNTHMISVSEQVPIQGCQNNF